MHEYYLSALSPQVIVVSAMEAVGVMELMTKFNALKSEAYKVWCLRHISVDLLFAATALFFFISASDF